MNTLNLADWQIDQRWPAAVIAGHARYAAQGRDLASPIDGAVLGTLDYASAAELSEAISAAQAAFRAWRTVPAPRRGELVRRIGELVRQRKPALAQLVTLETGKIVSEAEGEVQEWIDLCDYAVGLSRQLYGLTIASERAEHRLSEQWLPLGAVAVISAFNFPVAVWAWNAMLALVCGDSVLWKPSEKTPLSALAAVRIVLDAMVDCAEAPPALVQLLNGSTEVGQQLAADPRLPLVSATGSVAMGRQLAPVVAARLGRSLLELGGNNAAIVGPSADLELAVRAIVFAAAGTCGQRCTTLRRLIVHRDVIDTLLPRLVAAYRSLMVGDPRNRATLVGPLINEAAWSAMQAALAEAVLEGGTLLAGGTRVVDGVPAGGVYVYPALVRMPMQGGIVHEETFAPILYVLVYDTLDEAIALNNAVEQGLSSALFTRDLLDAERFLGPAGSDCGLANINTGTSGAEIGGAFGGEKATGGGRESGSDSWRAYMRRATQTINYGEALPLAQGVRFGD
ncbi:L-piperidine-6-carboxylate dehydrogenase [Chitinolyticbacter albus]|uniref:L-piperidine-6-carboxylate dehydrogenase n=1 Tax=Chitinolyticbacter albus TaxID=2961951 RepID=UPI00210A3BBD|nr:aldehyde dehydrogenase family protein [Chitinolyticbacter albus]